MIGASITSPTEEEPMARYVVIEFINNPDAEAFVEQLNNWNDHRRKVGDPFLSRVVGIFVKPGRTCQCPDAGRANYGDKNWKPASVVFGARFGWWVCTRCKKPRKAGHQLINQLKLSETYQGVEFDEYEFGVTDLSVSGFHRDQINRLKKLRLKKEKK
jgi:hypothetical protein